MYVCNSPQQSILLSDESVTGHDPGGDEVTWAGLRHEVHLCLA